MKLFINLGPPLDYIFANVGNVCAFEVPLFLITHIVFHDLCLFCLIRWILPAICGCEHDLSLLGMASGGLTTWRTAFATFPTDRDVDSQPCMQPMWAGEGLDRRCKEQSRTRAEARMSAQVRFVTSVICGPCPPLIV